MSIPKSAVVADLSAVVDGAENDAADVVNPLLEVRGHLRAGRVAVSATDAHVKTLSEALVAAPPLSLNVDNSGGDETLALTLDEAPLVTPDAAQTLANKTLMAAAIASFLNAQHGHANAAGGGQLDASDVFASGTVPTARLPLVSTGQAGILPAPVSGDAGNVLKGDGTWGDPATGGGTVTEVGLSLPAAFDVANSPLTQDGTFGVTKAAQTANRIFAAPDGSNGAPAFRALAKADLPALAAGDIGNLGMTAIVPWTTLGAPAASINLSGIPSTYGALLLQLIVRSTAASAVVTADLRFNGDSGSNYRGAQAVYLATIETSDYVHDRMMLTAIPGASGSAAGYFGIANIWLSGYAVTGQPRTVYARSVTAVHPGTYPAFPRIAMGQWLNTTNAISSIALYSGAGDFAAGTRYALFGLK